MKRMDIIGMVAGGAFLTAAIILLAMNDGRAVLGKQDVEYFVVEVGKNVSGIKDGLRNIGEAAEVWAERAR